MAPSTQTASAQHVRRDQGVRAAWACADASVWFIALLGAHWFRGLYVGTEPAYAGVLGAALAGSALHLLMGWWAGPYRRGQLRGSYEEIAGLTQTALMVTLVLLVYSVVAGEARWIAGTVAVLAGLVTIMAMLAVRLVVRAWRMRQRGRPADATPIVVFGAGSAGRLLVHTLLHDAASPYHPVAVLDDDPGKRSLRLDGVKVLGGRDRITDVAEKLGVEHFVIAIPTADASTMRDLRAIAEAAGMKTLVMPSLSSLINRPLRGTDLRDINLEDLLGRHPVQLDEASIADQLAGKVVLVTGAGGSIGSELCRQITRFGARRLVLLDRDESALQAVELDLEGHGLLDSDRIVLADIRDPEALARAFAHHRPEVVFHAAALKHLPLLQQYPMEAWQTNVIGTRNVLQAAADHGVETFVNISTDKAADPTSVLGYSKRIAERVTADFASKHEGKYLSVRFGNVLGSRGSVVPAFTAQIRRGGPVTVTHPDVERYFMLIPEACQLVLQASVLGRGGEVMVLDMGQPVKIAHVAKALIDLAERDDVEIHYMGLRPGEKLSEDLFAAQGIQAPTEHELITCTYASPMSPSLIGAMPVAPHSSLGVMRMLATGQEDESLAAVLFAQQRDVEAAIAEFVGSASNGGHGSESLAAGVGERSALSWAAGERESVAGRGQQHR